MQRNKLQVFFITGLCCSILLCACTSKNISAQDAQRPAPGAELSGDNVRAIAAKEDIPDADELDIPAERTIKIGYLAQNETIQFNTYLSAALLDETLKYGGQVEVEMVDARGIAANQVSQAEDMVVKDVDAVIISAYDQDASAPALDILAAAGIPIVAVNTVTTNIELASAYVGTDDKEAGIKAVQLMSKALDSKGTIHIMKGLLGDPANEKRMIGLEAELDNHPELIVGAQLSADWDRGKAMSLTEDWIISGKEFDGVIALNDEMAISASNALQTAGRADVMVVGVDAIDEALMLIKDGKMYGSVFQDADAQGRGALNVAVAAVLGEDVHKDYIIPYEPVTIANVDSYMGRYST